MKNTRMISWLLIMVLLLCSMAFPVGAEEEMKLLSIVAIEGETVWMHTSQGLVPFDEEGIQIGEPLYPGADCYAIGPDGHIYYSIEGDIFAIGSEGNEVDRWITPIDNFVKLLVNDTYIFIMGDDEYGAIHMQNHIMSSGIASGVKDIGFYNEDSFVLMQSEEMTSLLVQIDSNTMEDIAIEALFYDFDIAASSEEGGFYLYSERDMSYLDSFGGKLSGYKTFLDGEHILDIIVHQNTIYAIADNQLHVYELKNEAAEKKVLTIYNGLTYSSNKRFQKAIELFEQQNPDYTVQITDGTMIAKVNTALMANEPGYELMVLSPAYNLANYKNSGILAELSGNESIIENIAQLREMPFLFENDGRLYGVPITVAPMGFMISKALMDECGIEIDLNWTWDNLREIANAAKDKDMKLIEESGTGWSAVREQYECVYTDLINGTANYDTDTFHGLVSLWKEFQMEGLLADPVANEQTLLEYGMMPVVMNPDWWQSKVYLGMPMVDGEHVTPIYMDALYANAQSEHIDAAIEFMEIFSKIEVQKENVNPSFLPDLELHTEYVYWEMFNEVPTEEQMELWQHFLSTGVLIENNSEFSNVTSELFQMLWKDKISVDEFVAEVQERADLMIGE